MSESCAATITPGGIPIKYRRLRYKTDSKVEQWEYLPEGFPSLDNGKPLSALLVLDKYVTEEVQSAATPESGSRLGHYVGEQLYLTKDKKWVVAARVGVYSEEVGSSGQWDALMGSSANGAPSGGPSVRHTPACPIHIIVGYLHIRSCHAMRTNIDIDDGLMRQAMRRSGARTKRAAVEAGLRLLVEIHAQGSIRRLRGKVQWEGNLNRSRLGRAQE